MSGSWGRNGITVVAIFGTLRGSEFEGFRTRNGNRDAAKGLNSEY